MIATDLLSKAGQRCTLVLEDGTGPPGPPPPKNSKLGGISMSKIIGTANSSFKGNEGTQITGTILHVTDPIDPKRGQGESADHFFLSAAKLVALDFTPAVGRRDGFL